MPSDIAGESTNDNVRRPIESRSPLRFLRKLLSYYSKMKFFAPIVTLALAVAAFSIPAPDADNCEPAGASCNILGSDPCCSGVCLPVGIVVGVSIHDA